MNAMTKLLTNLDQVFGFDDKKKSTYRKVSETFDQNSNEHIILIEYRIRRSGGGVVSKQPKENGILQSVLRQKQATRKS